MEKQQNKLKLIKDKIEEDILNSNFDQEKINCLLFIITKIDKNGFLKTDKNELIKEIEYFNNIKTTKKELENNIKIIQQISKIGICTLGINDFLKYQINQNFLKNKITTKEKDILLQISNNIKSANFNFAIQKFVKTDIFKSLNTEERKNIIENFLNLKPYPITNTNIKQQESFENSKDNVDFFISTTQNGTLDIKINTIKIPENLIITLKNLENEININKNNNNNESEKYIE